MNLIDQIKSNLTITELINRLGLCPNKSGFICSIYKKEKVPSLKIYPETDSYFDFSTDTGGDIINFYEDYYHIDTKQAVQELAKMLNLKTESTYYNSHLKVIASPKQRLKLLPSESYYFNERAGIYEYEAGLKKNEAEKYAFQDLMSGRKTIQRTIYHSLYTHCTLDLSAHNYLISAKRKLNEATITKFKIFSLKEDAEKFLKDSFTSEELMISGLFNQSGHFVFTNHRLIIPYLENNQIIYLRGRYLPEDDETPRNRGGKYIGLNNFAGNLTSKRFFNADALKNKSDHRLVVTEGEFDTMIADQNGANAIGIPGVSNFPQDKIHLLSHFEIYLVLDNDSAGATATNKISKYFNRKIHILKIKKGKDLTEAL